MIGKKVFAISVVLGVVISLILVSSNTSSHEEQDTRDSTIIDQDCQVTMTPAGIVTGDSCTADGDPDHSDGLCRVEDSAEPTEAGPESEADNNDPDEIVFNDDEQGTTPTVFLVREDSTEGSPCQPKTEAQLYDQLRNLGEFNNRYMGITPDNFPDILEISKVKNDTYEPERFNPQRANKVLKHQIEQLMKTYDWSKEEATAQAQKLGLQDIKTPEELNISRRMTRDVDGGEGTTTINYCLPRGSETEDRFIRLCTVCAATTELPENYFPRYINEAICDPDGSGRACFPFEGTTEGHGMCKQRVFNLSMLKRTGNCVPTQGDGEVLYLEEWEVYTQPIRVWCDCELYRQSFLAEMTK
ncbi:uncharacterized protein [Ptychodera flava]|uniref:uncharacterized protein isoform X4 n=1 Tax=Ptychodera flava TaxID=63121 RepID=UPI00396A0634